MPSTNNLKKFPADHLELTADLKNLPCCMAFVSDRARQLGFSSKRIAEIELVIEEALINIIDYAYPDQNGCLKLELKTEPENSFRLRITDQGAAFNPLERKAPDLEAGLMERPIGGLGIFLIKELADDIFWQRQGNENHLTIIFTKRHA